MAKVGWIGTGNMGVPMSKNLIKAGHEVTVWNRTKEKADPVVEAGGKWADTPAAAANGAEFIFIMVADGKALKNCVFGPNGIVDTLAAGAIVTDMSTVAPAESAECNEKIEAKGAKFLRAPVTGSTILAEAGTIGILASGDKAAYDKALPACFEKMGKNQFYLGGGEEARTMKLILNMMIGTSMQMLAESLVVGEKVGMDLNQMLEVISGSVVGSPLVNYKVKLVSEGLYTPAFSVDLMKKDFDLADVVAKELNVPTPITSITRQFLSAASSAGYGNKDFSVLIKVLEELSAVKR